MKRDPGKFSRFRIWENATILKDSSLVARANTYPVDDTQAARSVGDSNRSSTSAEILYMIWPFGASSGVAMYSDSQLKAWIRKARWSDASSKSHR